MRRLDLSINSVNKNHKTENYSGPLSSTGDGGHRANMNNLHNSQVNGTLMMPYGISSRPKSGMKAQAVVNDDSDSAIIGVYDPQRPKVKTGEICIYSSSGASIYLTADGYIDVKCKGFRINGKDIS